MFLSTGMRISEHWKLSAVPKPFANGNHIIGEYECTNSSSVFNMHSIEVLINPQQSLTHPSATTALLWNSFFE
jgi:hypothetical protein